MKRLYLITAILLTFFMSCTKNFEKFNEDIKNPSVVDGEYLFSNAQKELVDQISSTNVNLNIFKLVAQYWTETTYTDESNYDLVTRRISDNTFTVIETEEQKQNKLFIIDILEVYAYQNLVDIFGDVPYTEAIDIDNINPVYDDAATIYADFLTRLDADMAGLNVDHESFGTADLIYGGNVAAWVKFANSLKLKIGINLADVNPTAAQTAVESAVVGGVFTSSWDDALLYYLSATPNTNPLYEDLILSGRKDFVAANTIVDIMNSLADPRMDLYFSYKIADAYVGGNYGFSSTYANYSHVSNQIQTPDFPGILLTYTEVQFYLAEAAARGFDVGTTTEDAYNAGITASIFYWGGDQTMADAYLANPDVAYGTAAGTWQQKIGTQSWIALYTRGQEAWNTYRRLDYPAMNEAEAPETGGPVPTRFTYPINEQTLNAVNYAAAAEAIGGDDMLTKLFWDLYDPQ
jgi:hypothetical protein